MMVQVFAFALLFCVCAVHSLDNGLARTPPMGWLHWERFRCNIDCKNDPQHCIGENLFKTMADRMVADGFKDAGYEYVNIDDCWLAKTRDPATGRLRPDPDRFPHGMKALADYIHGKGLKFGIYEDFGTHTCAGYPGSEYYLQLDAQTFADWGVDFLKLDGCYSDPKSYSTGYPPLAFFLNMTKHPIFLSCEYPLYEQGRGLKPNYPDLVRECNMARTYTDMQDSWESVLSTIQYYATDKYNFSQYAGPGYFNDPDELIIGNFGLSYDQQRVQMGMWSMMAAPLLMSVDLRTIRNESRALLLNKGAIAINQDAMGKQGRMVHQMGKIQVWRRPVLPEGSFAFAFVNTGDADPTTISVKLVDLGMTSAKGYKIDEVFDAKPLGILKPGEKFTTTVNPTGIFFGKATKVV